MGCITPENQARSGLFFIAAHATPELPSIKISYKDQILQTVWLAFLADSAKKPLHFPVMLSPCFTNSLSMKKTEIS